MDKHRQVTFCMCKTFKGFCSCSSPTLVWWYWYFICSQILFFSSARLISININWCSSVFKVSLWTLALCTTECTDTLKFMWTWLNPSNTGGLFCSETEEFFGGVQTVTQSQRLHSTAHKCSTFNTAADVQEDSWLTITPRSKLSEEGNLYLVLSRSGWKQVELLRRRCLEKKSTHLWYRNWQRAAS